MCCIPQWFQTFELDGPQMKNELMIPNLSRVYVTRDFGMAPHGMCGMIHPFGERCPKNAIEIFTRIVDETIPGRLLCVVDDSGICDDDATYAVEFIVDGMPYCAELLGFDMIVDPREQWGDHGWHREYYGFG